MGWARWSSKMLGIRIIIAIVSVRQMSLKDSIAACRCIIPFTMLSPCFWPVRYSAENLVFGSSPDAQRRSRRPLLVMAVSLTRGRNPGSLRAADSGRDDTKREIPVGITRKNHNGNLEFGPSPGRGQPLHLSQESGSVVAGGWIRAR
jgi:hypothetical protein